MTTAPSAGGDPPEDSFLERVQEAFDNLSKVTKKDEFKKILNDVPAHADDQAFLETLLFAYGNGDDATRKQMWGIVLMAIASGGLSKVPPSTLPPPPWTDQKANELARQVGESFLHFEEVVNENHPWDNTPDFWLQAEKGNERLMGAIFAVMSSKENKRKLQYKNVEARIRQKVTWGGGKTDLLGGIGGPPPLSATDLNAVITAANARGDTCELIFSQNMNTLNEKTFKALESFVGQLDPKPVVVLIQEFMQSKTKNNKTRQDIPIKRRDPNGTVHESMLPVYSWEKYVLSGYKPLRYAAHNDGQRGVGYWARDDVDVEPVSGHVSSLEEYIFVRRNDPKHIYCSVYLAAPQKNQVKDLVKWVNTVAKENPEHDIVLCGDFNLDLGRKGQNEGINWSKDFLEKKVSEERTLQRATTGATRPAAGTLIDWILTTTKFEWDWKGTLDTKMPDHHGLYLLLQTKEHQEQPPPQGNPADAPLAQQQQQQQQLQQLQLDQQQSPQAALSDEVKALSENFNKMSWNKKR